jgi:cryptochrome
MFTGPGSVLIDGNSCRLQTHLYTPDLTIYSLDCQNDLSKSITKLNEKSKLFLMREAPQTLFPKLFKAWEITHLVFEKDTDAYARDRDSEIRKAAEEAGVEVITKSGRTLWDSDELVKKTMRSQQ